MLGTFADFPVFGFIPYANEPLPRAQNNNNIASSLSVHTPANPGPPAQKTRAQRRLP